MARFEIVIELFAQPGRDLLQHFRGLDRRAHAAVNREQHRELGEVGFDRRLHVRILQLGGERAPVMARRAMHLAERGGRRRLMREPRELCLPVGPKLRRHAPPDERPAHRRRLTLKLTELGGIFSRQRLGDGGEQLRHLHDRALQPAQRGSERGCVAVALSREPEQSSSGDARGHAADIGADFAVAERAGAEAILLLVGAIIHGARGPLAGQASPHIGSQNRRCPPRGIFSAPGQRQMQQ